MGKSCAISTDGGKGETLKAWIYAGGKCPLTKWSSPNNNEPFTPLNLVRQKNNRIYCDSGCEDQHYGYSYCSGVDTYTYALPDDVISRIIYHANLPYTRYDEQGSNPYWVYPERKMCEEIMGIDCDDSLLERWRKLGGDGVGKMSDAELKNYITAVGPTYCNKIVREDCGIDPSNGSAIFKRWVYNGGRCYAGENEDTTFAGGRSCTTGCRTDSYPSSCA